MGYSYLMTFDQLVEFIKGEGCRIYIYENKASIYGGNLGTFYLHQDNGPIICIATKSMAPKKKVETLLHEFGHYLQWVDGFMQSLDAICDSYTIEDKWLNYKIELDEQQLKVVRNTMLAMEYDAEKRAIKVGDDLQPEDYHRDFFLQGAASYMDGIKWSFVRRRSFYECPSRKKYKPRILTFEELFAPLTPERLKVLDRELLKKY